VDSGNTLRRRGPFTVISLIVRDEPYTNLDNESELAQTVRRGRRGGMVSLSGAVYISAFG
jgi:hypothetical protein